MKKIISIFLTLIIVFYSLSINLFASAISLSKDIVIIFENGDYITETITTETVLNRATNTITGQKTSNYRNSDNELLWSATLKGTFTYTGSRATCTASSITYKIYDDNWKITSAAASKSGNTAKGDITAKRYVLGIPTKTVERTITLTCSSSGVLS